MQSSPDISKATSKPANNSSARIADAVQSVKNAFSRRKDWADKNLKHLKKKGFKYWVGVAILIPLSMLVGEYLSEHRMLIGPRYVVYYGLQKITPRAPEYFQHTAVVAIGDKEYWQGELARRVPLRKDYLAKLILKLADSKAPVIAIDVDLRSPPPNSSSAYDELYKKETDELLEAIHFASEGVRRDKEGNKVSVDYWSHIILPRTVISPGEDASLDMSQYTYRTEACIYDGEHFNDSRVHQGFVSLPRDIRQVPIVLNVENLQKPLYSFAAAATQTQDPKWLLNRRATDPLPYGIFLDNPKPLAASEVLATSPHELEVNNRIVLIGGTWHLSSYGQGNVVDTHYTPVGEIGGVFVHANYMEALRTHWSSKPLGKSATTGIELSLTILIALVFAWQMSPLKRFFWTLGVPLFLVIITCFLWQNLGIFFDFFIPLVLLGAHAVVDKILEWRRRSGAYGELVALMKSQTAPLEEVTEGEV